MMTSFTCHAFVTPSKSITTVSTRQVRLAMVVEGSSGDDESSDGNNSVATIIMVNGMPGPMATAAAEACLRKGLQLSPVAMTGPDVEECIVTVTDDVTGRSSEVRLIPSTNTQES